jgi:hypothetical protein
LPQPELLTPPAGAGLRYYLREAFAVARWDDSAVERASRDDKALLYGLAFWALAFLLGIGSGVLKGLYSGREVPVINIIVAVVLFMPLLAGATLIYYGICHLVARWLFGASGSYLALLRVMMLGSVVQWTGVIPVVGGLVASLWSLGVFMYVFSEVDHIERMQAVAISIGLGITFLVVAYFVASAFMPH